MNKFFNSILFDVDQQKNSLGKNVPLQDFVNKGDVTTVSGITLYLAAVADGGGKTAPEQAAKLAVDTLFMEIKRRTEKNPVEILRNALLSTNQLVYQQFHEKEDYAGITIVAIKDDTAYVGQVGKLTGAYFVRNNSNEQPDFPFLLDKSGGNICLGDNLNDPKVLVEQYPHKIKRGERVIIASDGLFDPPEEGGREGAIKEKVKNEIPRIGQYDDIRGSARHLSSIAKGMDSADDITVMVLGFGRKPRAVSPLILTMIGGAILIVVLISIAWLWPKQAPQVPDFGVAYIISGNANVAHPASTSMASAVGQFIYPKDVLSASGDGPINLELETRSDAQSSNATPISGVNIYLAKTTSIALDVINPASVNTQGQPTNQAIPQSQFTLINGQLLIVSDGSRSFVVSVSLPKGDTIQVTLNSGGQGVLGVAYNDSKLNAACMAGSCLLALPNSQPQLLVSPGKVVIDLNSSISTIQAQSLTDSENKDWKSLCEKSQIQLPGQAQSPNCVIVP